MRKKIREKVFFKPSSEFTFAVQGRLEFFGANQFLENNSFFVLINRIPLKSET